MEEVHELKYLDSILCNVETWKMKLEKGLYNGILHYLNLCAS